MAAKASLEEAGTTMAGGLHDLTTAALAGMNDTCSSSVMIDDDRWQRIRAVHDDLCANQVIEPLAAEAADSRLWLDCDLVTMVEHRFSETLDPCVLTPEQREHWASRAVARDERLRDPHKQAPYLLCYWILDRGERVGTIALETTPTGMCALTARSLYLWPSHRKRGIGRRILRAIWDTACARGVDGLRLPTHWTWQRAVSFYFSIGMWVTSWKHSLVFAWYRGLPEYRITVADDIARFGVVCDSTQFEDLITARRDGGRLVWGETAALQKLRDERSDVYLYGVPTFSVALARHGFPLVRSEERWKRRYWWSDVGEPEGFAYKLQVFEEFDCKNGFDVRTPVVPGLPPLDDD